MIKKKLNILHFKTGKPALKKPFMYGFVRYSGVSLNAEYYLFPFSLIEKLKNKINAKKKAKAYRNRNK